MYKVMNRDVFYTFFKPNLILRMSGIVFSIVVLIYVAISLYTTFRTSLKVKLVFPTWVLLSLPLIICLTAVIYSIIIMLRFLHQYSKDLTPEYVRIDDDGIHLISLSQKDHVYLFSDLRDNLIVNMGFSERPSLVFFYDSLSDFLNSAIFDLSNALRGGILFKDKMNLLSILIKPMDGYKEGRKWHCILISPPLIGGLDGVKKMIEEWRVKYENYLKRMGKYEKVAEIKSRQVNEK